MADARVSGAFLQPARRCRSALGWTGAQGGAEAPVAVAVVERVRGQELDGLIAEAGGRLSLKAAVSRIDEARGLAQVAGAAQYPLLSLGGNVQRRVDYGTARERRVRCHLRG
ncbi:hypothetical protein ACVBEG_27055 [Pseudomonas sp. GG8]